MIGSICSTGPAPTGAWSAPSSRRGTATDGSSWAACGVRVEPRAEYVQMLRDGWRFMRDFLYVDNQHGAPWNDRVGVVRRVASRRASPRGLQPPAGHALGRDRGRPIPTCSAATIPTWRIRTPGCSARTWRKPTGFIASRASTRATRGGLARPARSRCRGWRSPRATTCWPSMESSCVRRRIPTACWRVRAGRTITVTVSSSLSAEQARDIVVEPIANESFQRMWAWVAANQARVDELSGGRLAYVWLPNTSRNGYEFFNRMYYAQKDREGAVIDERNNGGGSAADYIVDMLDRELTGYFNSPGAGRKPWTQPMAGLFGPKVMIINRERRLRGRPCCRTCSASGASAPSSARGRGAGWSGRGTRPRWSTAASSLPPAAVFSDVDGKWARGGRGRRTGHRGPQRPGPGDRGWRPAVGGGRPRSVAVAGDGEGRAQGRSPRRRCGGGGRADRGCPPDRIARMPWWLPDTSTGSVRRTRTCVLPVTRGTAGAPTDCYTKKDSDDAIVCAERLVGFARRQAEQRSGRLSERFAVGRNG